MNLDELMNDPHGYTSAYGAIPSSLQRKAKLLCRDFDKIHPYK